MHGQPSCVVTEENTPSTGLCAEGGAKFVRHYSMAASKTPRDTRRDEALEALQVAARSLTE